MIIRTEMPEDYNEVYQLNYLAFNNREDEAKLVERIRTSSTFIPDLSIVTVKEGEIIGHILLSEAIVKGKTEQHKVIVLAPIVVHPALQKKGIGSKLIEEGIRRVGNLHYGLILLIGHPTYYPKFGFQPARQYGFELRQFNVPDDVFMVYEVQDGELDRIKGELIYPDTFFES